MKKYFVAAVLLFGLSITPKFGTTADAQEVEPTPAPMIVQDVHDASTSVLDRVLHSIFTAVASAAAAALTAWAVAMARRNGIQLTSEQQALLKEYATQAILYAEETAMKYVQENASNVALSSLEKLNMAKDFLRRKASAAGIPLSDLGAHDTIHAVLPSTGFGALGDRLGASPAK